MTLHPNGTFNCSPIRADQRLHQCFRTRRAGVVGGGMDDVVTLRTRFKKADCYVRVQNQKLVCDSDKITDDALFQWQ